MIRQPALDAACVEQVSASQLRRLAACCKALQTNRARIFYLRLFFAYSHLIEALQLESGEAGPLDPVIQPKQRLVRHCPNSAPVVTTAAED